MQELSADAAEEARKRRLKKNLEKIRSLCHETDFARLPQKTLINFAKTWGVPLRSVSFVRKDIHAKGCTVLFDTSRGLRNVEGIYFFTSGWVAGD